MNTTFKAFGAAIKNYRYSFTPKVSQTSLCKKVNSKINKSSKTYMLYQRKLSRIEKGDDAILLPLETILALVEICEIPEVISKPYIDLIKDFNMNYIEDSTILSIQEYNNLISSCKNKILNAYLGEYYCYFHSTDSSNQKIITGKMKIFYSDSTPQKCAVELIIEENNTPIKWYSGQLILNLHYQMIYIILIGKEKQELNFLICNHFNSTLNSNLLNVALVLTTSAGTQKRPTTHRMIISRKKLTSKTIQLIKSQLKLNTDIINISEDSLNNLEKIIKQNPNDYKQGTLLLQCIEYIKKLGHKKTYYTIDESIIYDSNEIASNEVIRSYLVTTLRDFSDNEYYNKISDTVNQICFSIINELDE